ncbi:MAG: 1-acyl-sn-glycerol-3-phosphate acyltransferase [Cyclobacteriaceae bacterium]|nr:1-acyl-sn-glycerol-3-phosphate acyltransferase [Cyclobacteriaceae bacterium]
MKFLRRIHTIWGLLGFMLCFAVLLPFFLVPIYYPKLHHWTGKLNRIWAKGTLLFCFLGYRVKVRAPLNPLRSYIFCPNHFSYLDIPTMGLNPIDSIFVGKSSMENIPVFGWMYSRLHITVDRSRLRSKYSTYVKSGQALDEGKSIVIYPEGGIFSAYPPELAPFKEGPFRLAIEKQIPIVPVTIPNNWIILPPHEFLVRLGVVEVIFHEPVSTAGMTLADMNQLMDRVYTVIDNELKAHGNKPGNAG